MENKSSVFFLVFSLPVIFFVITISNIVEYAYAEFWSNALNLIITSILLVACIANNFKMRTSGKHGKAWISFTVAIALWYIAERIWTLNESSTNIGLSYADLFWLGGYVFYFVFGIMYLKPFAHQISQRNIITTTFIISMVLILIFYVTKLQIDTFENILYASYPVVDSIMLIPSILGMILFFKGRVKFSWMLFFFGMLIFVIADYGFMYFDSINEYYTGHLVDVPYIWAYAIFISGVIGNWNLWNRANKNRPFNDQDTMR